MFSHTPSNILCPLCGISFQPSSLSNICTSCLIAQNQPALGITTDELIFCRHCLRYERPPWIKCERESKDFLAIALKKVKLPKTHTIMSAKFVWTEPHSRRVKLQLTLQHKLNSEVSIQGTVVVQFVEKDIQCPDCSRKFTEHDWGVLVQIRQPADHKRTLHNLEQNLIRQKFSEKIMKIEQAQHGLDLYFRAENDANRHVDFIKSHVPCIHKVANTLISVNVRSNKAHLKITHSLIVVRTCKDDLVQIPQRLQKKLANCSQFLLCTKVGSLVHFMDIVLRRKIAINAADLAPHQPYMAFYPLRLYGRVFRVLDWEQPAPQTHNSYPSSHASIVSDEEGSVLHLKTHIRLNLDDQVIAFDLRDNEEFVSVVKDCPCLIAKVKTNKKPQTKAKKSKKQQQEKKETPELNEVPSEKQEVKLEWVEQFNEDDEELV